MKALSRCIFICVWRDIYPNKERKFDRLRKQCLQSRQKTEEYSQGLVHAREDPSDIIDIDVVMEKEEKQSHTNSDDCDSDSDQSDRQV